MATLLYVSQTYPDIIVETGIDIAAATETSIIYQSPTGTRGKWEGSLEGTTAVRYTLGVNDLFEAGTWKLQSYVIIGGRAAYGQIEEFEVGDPLQQQNQMP